ncbi:MAG TPA: FAD-dependent oxidoreductase [Paracoccaceae bacterium]|nr:FAD-dependent oxidoreductase [Paracoccaceae bacterium]
MQRIVVIGAGIVGVSAAIWLRRAGRHVTLVDRAEPGQGTSHGNAGVLASCSVVPVTVPGLVGKAPRMLLNPDFPLFLRWSYLPRLAPWLARYLSHANETQTRRIASALAHVVGDSVEQHKALAAGTSAERFIRDSDYVFAYADRSAFEADAYGWELRRQAGFTPDLIEGDAVREYDPALGDSIGFLAVMKDHGYILDPGGYVRALSEEFTRLGGRVLRASVEDFDLSAGRIGAVLTSEGRLDCDAAVLATGVWSKPLMRKLGLTVPLETERGYHIVFRNPSVQPKAPTMIASGKFVATPMADGLRCAGMVEFGGLDSGPSKAPLELLRRKVAQAFPELTADEEITWLGHRPAPADSLPIIGEVQQTGVYSAFGHHHVGLTGGPKTGRMVAGMIADIPQNVDPAPYSPQRFG